MCQDCNADQQKQRGIATTTGARSFRLRLRAILRLFWEEPSQPFVSLMVNEIERSIRRAWERGAMECDVRADELTQEELDAMQSFIVSQSVFVPRLRADIIEARQGGGDIEPFYRRIDLWVNRYNEAMVQSAATACANKKKKWHLGPTEEHCKSCGGFDGRVYRYKVWIENQALPQAQSLACNGYQCKCRLKDTDGRVTPGRFPSSLLGDE